MVAPPLLGSHEGLAMGLYQGEASERCLDESLAITKACLDGFSVRSSQRPIGGTTMIA
jgi:hypothetical protein